MIVVPPVQINALTLVSSTIPEPDTARGEVLWNPSTDYAEGTVVIRTTTHRKYERIGSGVDAGLPENTPKLWLDVGATNRWAMFDLTRNESSSSNSGVIEFVVKPGKRINTMALLGVQATKVKVEIFIPSNTDPVYEFESDMTTRNTTSWSDYFFGAFGYRPSVLIQDLPPYTDATFKVTVTNTNTGTETKLSSVIMGNKVYLGATQYNARSDSMNFSTVNRDEFGNSVLVRRRSVPKTNQTLWTPKDLVNSARTARNDLNAVPALWSGLDDVYDDPYFEALLILGIYKQFEIDISNPSVAKINLELEEI